MGTQVIRGRGKLYRIGSEQFVDEISYQLHEDSSAEAAYWWGEFTLDSSQRPSESDRYIVELEDGRRGESHLKKLVNRVVRGVPPRYMYRFTGTSLLE